MTSKSLKRARHKAALKQKEVSAPSAVTAAAGSAAPRRRDWSRVVSEAMVAGRWENALEGLVSMRRDGQVEDHKLLIGPHALPCTPMKCNHAVSFKH